MEALTSNYEELEAVDSLEENLGSHRIGGGRYNDFKRGLLKIKQKSRSWHGFEKIHPLLKQKFTDRNKFSK